MFLNIINDTYWYEDILNVKYEFANQFKDMYKSQDKRLSISMRMSIS